MLPRFGPCVSKFRVAAITSPLVGTSARTSSGMTPTGFISWSCLGELAGGLDYANVSKVVARFARRLGEDPGPRRELTAIEQQLSNDKI